MKKLLSHNLAEELKTMAPNVPKKSGAISSKVEKAEKKKPKVLAKKSEQSTAEKKIAKRSKSGWETPSNVDGLSQNGKTLFASSMVLGMLFIFTCLLAVSMCDLACPVVVMPPCTKKPCLVKPPIYAEDLSICPVTWSIVKMTGMEVAPARILVVAAAQQPKKKGRFKRFLAKVFRRKRRDEL